jgi:hypothetical protein
MAKPTTRSAFVDRVPFEEAITDDLLLGKAYKQLTKAQQTILRIIYGLDLDADGLAFWEMFHGGWSFDSLGYPVERLSGIIIPPYRPKEYDIASLILGRRAGKSDRIGGMIGAYEITLGGHTQYARPDQDLFYLYIAQDLPTAKTNMAFIVANLQDSKFLSKEVLKDFDDEKQFANGILLRAEPPKIKTSRGSAVVGVNFDEVGFWYKDAASANPDFEVERSVSYAMQQFPNAKQLRISTPWTMEGLLYEAHLAGTEGYRLTAGAEHELEAEEFEGHVVLHAPTATVGSMAKVLGSIERERAKLQKLQKKDREAYERESLAKFTGAVGTYLTAGLVSAAVDKAVKIRPPKPGIFYVAAMDPAFRHDTFAFNIWHHDPTLGLVQDVVLKWVPKPGERLKPGEVLDDIKPFLDAYNIDIVFTDQYQLESLQDLAELRGFTIVGVDFTAKSKVKIWGNFSMQLRQGRIRLLDDPQQERELHKLQKVHHASGNLSIAAPPGQKDDLAMCAALGVHQALFYKNEEEDFQEKKEPSLKARILARIGEKAAASNDPALAQGLHQMEVQRLLLELTGDDAEEGVDDLVA